MPHLSKKEKRKRLAFVIAISAAIGLLLIFVIRSVSSLASSGLRVLLAWVVGIFSIASFSISTSTTALSTATSTTTIPVASLVDSSATSSLASSLPLASTSTSTLSSATFTERFTGTGWEDTADTNAYEDYVANTISLVPDFSVRATQDSFTPASANPSAAEGLTGTVNKDGGTYRINIPAFPDLDITSPYSGILRFGYDPVTKKTLIIYAAYESRVIEMGPKGSDGAIGMIGDYSGRFGPRAFGGATGGELAVHPVIFSEDGAWWIASGEGSAAPKLMKVQDGAVIDYTQTAFPDETTLRAAPGPAAHEVYVAGDSSSYILTDNGFTQTSARWVSSRLNQTAEDIVSGEIVNVDANDTFSDAAASGSAAAEYFLSDDGGATWTAATPGRQITFAHAGTDLRYKVVLTPGSNRYSTPWVNLVTMEYFFKKSGL